MMVGFYLLLVVCVLVGALPWPTLLALGGIYRLGKVWRWFRQPAPDEPPVPVPVWPLWFAALAFVHLRITGPLLVLGLVISVIVGI